MIEVATKNSLNEMPRLEFYSICRLCVQMLDKEKVSPIFNNNTCSDKISLSEKIRYCSSIEVAEGDGLPPQICNNCLSKLNQSFVFRNQCVLADITLKRLKDISFSLSEVPDLLKVDFENQIIETKSDYFLKKEAITSELFEQTKNEKSIDEYENCKNGRHKRNTRKPNEISLQTLGCKTGDPGFLELDVSQVKKTCSSPGSDNLDKEKERSRKKGAIKEEDTQNEAKTKNLKMLKSNKAVADAAKQAEVGLEINFNQQTEVENFTIEPDMFNFNEIGTDENTKNIAELNFGEFTKKNVKKIVKPKSLGMKKGRRKKPAVAKEKPSSYTCDYCHKVYPSEGGWRYHIHTMHNENYQPFICDLCGQAFKVKKNLEGHKNSIHFHLKLHLCDLCGRGFASKYALKVHKIWHNDEKNFTCDVCGTKFRTRGKMNTHRSIHGGPKKFMCHICSRDFRWKKDFEIHMRTHTGEKPFKCSHCGKAFASLTNMKKHERNHLGKLEAEKTSEEFDMMATTADEKMYRNEFIDFSYGSDDLRSRQDSQV